MTSRRAVDMVQRLVRPAKAGHAGTLDPLATGVLVVCVGGATRFIEYVQRMPKRYVGTFLLGWQSPTEDVEGRLIELPNAPIPCLEEVQAAARNFVGRIEQRPPAFSALKIQGRPAYKLARQGKPVELAPRPVEIYRLEVKAYEYPKLVMEIDCSGGTYVRSLGRDLAESLGTAAVMSALVRTRIGAFHLEDSLDPSRLTGDTWLVDLQPPLRAVEYLPRVQLSADEATRVRNGLALERQTLAASPECAEHAAIDLAGQLIGVLRPFADGRWRTVRNLPTG
jgi:tRNA pseudouridine55 synthase